MEFFSLFLGIVGLWLGAEVAIRGALKIGDRYKISHGFLGLTVLAIGTDIPELFISIFTALRRSDGIATSELVIGGTIGTSFSQIGLMLGIIGLIGVLTFSRKKIMRDGLMLSGSILLFFIASLDGVITQTEGIIMIILYSAYFLNLLREEKLHEKFRIRSKHSHFWSITFVISGFVLLYYAANQTVESALHISAQWGLSQGLIGATIVGLGTSLPELATAITAIKKRAGDMAAGNLIGSTIFDVLFTIGIGSAIAEITIERHFLRFDIPVLFLLSILVVLFFFRKERLSKGAAILLIAIYLVYLLITLSEIFPLLSL